MLLPMSLRCYGSLIDNPLTVKGYQDVCLRCVKSQYMIYPFKQNHLVTTANKRSTSPFLFRLCETHYVNIYGGQTTSDETIEELCGFRQRETISYEDGNNLLVEFR